MRASHLSCARPLRFQLAMAAALAPKSKIAVPRANSGGLVVVARAVARAPSNQLGKFHFHSSQRLDAKKTVLELGDPTLRIPAVAVRDSEFGTAELRELVQDLIETMHACNGAGIAAPQIGVSKAVFVVEGTGSNPRYPYKPKIPLTVFINPKIEVLDATPMHLIEGCLSVPGFRGKVTRAAKVQVTARDINGNPFTCLCEGHAAGTMQHEYDHLIGKLFPDQAGSTPGGLMTWAAFDRFHKEEFFAYANKLSARYPKAIEFKQ